MPIAQPCTIPSFIGCHSLPCMVNQLHLASCLCAVVHNGFSRNLWYRDMAIWEYTHLVTLKAKSGLALAYSDQTEDWMCWHGWPPFNLFSALVVLCAVKTFNFIWFICAFRTSAVTRLSNQHHQTSTEKKMEDSLNQETTKIKSTITQTTRLPHQEGINPPPHSPNNILQLVFNENKKKSFETNFLSESSSFPSMSCVCLF